MQFNILVFSLSVNRQMLPGEIKEKIDQYVNKFYKSRAFFARQCDIGSGDCKCNKEILWTPCRVECRCSLWSRSQCCDEN